MRTKSRAWHSVGGTRKVPSLPALPQVVHRDPPVTPSTLSLPSTYFAHSTLSFSLFSPRSHLPSATTRRPSWQEKKEDRRRRRRVKIAGNVHRSREAAVAGPREGRVKGRASVTFPLTRRMSPTQCPASQGTRGHNLIYVQLLSV